MHRATMHIAIRSTAQRLIAAMLGSTVAATCLAVLIPAGPLDLAETAAAKPVPAGSPGVTR
jgi:hypothetical protein